MSAVIGTCIWCERKGPLKRHKTNKGAVKLVCEAFDGARNTCRPEDVEQDSMANMGNMGSMGSNANMSMMDIDLSERLTMIEDRFADLENIVKVQQQEIAILKGNVRNLRDASAMRGRTRSPPRHVPPPR